MTDYIYPFYDSTLFARSRKAELAWKKDAQSLLDNLIDPDKVKQLRAEANEILESANAKISKINEDVGGLIPAGIELPEIEVPEAEVDVNAQGLPLISSEWSWVEQTQRLKARKGYEGQDQDEDLDDGA